VEATVPVTVPLDGCVVAGGLGYSMGEIEALEPPRAIASGLVELDTASDGGLLPGAVWTVAGPSRAGVTELAVRIAVGASRTNTVVIGNGHMPSHVLLQRMLGEAARSYCVESVRARLSMASWLPLPFALDDGCYSWDSACEAADVVVMDTLDEMLRPAAWPSSDELVLLLRGLRETARRHGTAVVLTARTGRVGSGERDDDGWTRHLARAAFEDVGDVQIQVESGHPGLLKLAIYVRGMGQHDLMIAAGPVAKP
jgi:hypothetical protein